MEHDEPPRGRPVPHDDLPTLGERWADFFFPFMKVLAREGLARWRVLGVFFSSGPKRGVLLEVSAPNPVTLFSFFFFHH